LKKAVASQKERGQMSKGELDLLTNSRKADLNVQVLIKIQTSRERKTKRVIFVQQIFFTIIFLFSI
jgi:hypothetical protein